MMRSSVNRFGARVLISTCVLTLMAACSAEVDRQAMIEEGARARISEHVYVIPSKGREAIPNVGMIVGTKGSLVVDTGLGVRNGEIVWRELQKVHQGGTLYLAATHFHPEHIGGEQAFPAQAQVLRLKAQQEEVVAKGEAFLDLFRKMSNANKQLLQGFEFRKADTLFEREHSVDLGGVTVRLFSLGPAHTRGDTLMLVVEDGVLFGGDIVQKRLTPMMPDADSSAVSWLAILDEVEVLQPRVIVPSHGEIGDQSLIPLNREFLIALRMRVLECKQQGMSAKEAGALLRKEFESRYPDWKYMNSLPAAVERFYAEI